jgi:ABC-type nitrate/sulfonate/bicarbonate transport system substrate-binding protein
MEKLETIWYRKDPVPTALGVALQLGELQKDLRIRGIRLKPYEEGGPLPHYALLAANRWGALTASGERSAWRIIALAESELHGWLIVRSGGRLWKLRDLKGTSIGIPCTTRADSAEERFFGVLARRAAEACLAMAGIGVSEVRWVELPPNRRGKASSSAGRGTFGLYAAEVSALVREEADAVLLLGLQAKAVPDAIGADVLAELRGVRHPDGLPLQPPTVLAATAPLVDEAPELAERITAHLHRAVEWAEAHGEELYRAVASNLGLSEAALRDIYRDTALHRQLDIRPTGNKYRALDDCRQWLAAGGACPAAWALDEQNFGNALRLIAAGGIEKPELGSVHEYALRDVPESYFAERTKARILASEEEALETARAFADRIRAGASDRDRYRRLPFEEMKELAASGLLGLVVPKPYGGPACPRGCWRKFSKSFRRRMGRSGKSRKTTIFS